MGLIEAMAVAMLPAAGNFAGGLIAEVLTVSRKTLSYALHAAAGIVLGVVGIELVPEALATQPAWIPILAFAMGGLFFLLVDTITDTVAARFGGDAGPWVIFFGVSMDLFSDGVMIGAGSSISFSLAILLALGQVAGDIPEGFAVVANFKEKGVARRTRLLVSAAFVLPILAGTALSFLLVRGHPEIVQFSLLAFTAGILMTVIVEEVIPEAHSGGESRIATVALVGGFVLFALLSAYLG